MDLRSWKKVLAEWVKECNFLKIDFRTLEESDLEAFFDVYIQQDEVTLMFQQRQQEGLAQKCSSSQHLSLLLTFLRSIYPDFAPHLENGVVVGSDYIYVYTLLMHYACVKNPTEVFHSICKRLPDRTQECIAKFFEQTVEKSQLSRDDLRQAIVNVSVVYRRSDTEPSPKSGNRSRRRSTRGSSKSLNSSTSSNRSLNSSDGITDIPEIKLNVHLPESIPSPPPPDSTPNTQQRMPSRAKVPPPTPKSEMLDLQNRELLGLRAELQTKKYENNMLEEQIMENENLIAALTKDNIEKKQQLVDLKASMQSGEEGNGDIHIYVPNEIEHLKRSLRKEIAQKEAEITEMSDRLQDLQSENCELTSKLKTSETHLNVCMDRIGELETRLDETSEAVNIRLEELNCLKRDKKELEECLQQTRDELHQRREILNSSSDLLDTSTAASTGSHNITPENLASSVIDKQLREKQLENDDLESRLQTMVENHKKWSVKLKRRLSHYYGSVDKDELATWDDFVLIEKTLAHLEANWREEQQRASQLEETYEKLLVRQSQLLESIQQSNSKAKMLEYKLGQTQEDCLEHTRMHKLECERHVKEMNDLQEKLQHQEIKYEAHQKQFDNLMFRYEQLQTDAAKADRHLCEVRQQMAEKEHQIGQVDAELLQLRSKNEAHEERIDSLVAERSSEKQQTEEQIDELNKQIDEQQLTIKHVRCKYRQCKKELDLHSSRMDHLITELLQAADWEEAIAKVDGLAKSKAELEEKYSTEVASLEERLREDMCASEINEQQIRDLREELSFTNDRYEDQRSRHSEFCQKVQSDLLKREAELQDQILERQAISDSKVTNLRERLHYTRVQLERFLCKASKLLGGPRDDDDLAAGSGGGGDQDNIHEDDKADDDDGIDSDSSGCRFAENQNRIDEVTARIARNVRSRKQLLANLHEKTGEINELTKQHALALTGNQQWTAKMKLEQKANCEQLHDAMTEKDEELHTRDQRISALQDELSEEHSRVEQLMAKLAKTMERLESQDIAAMEMVASLNELMANNSVTSTIPCPTPPPTPSSLEFSSGSTNFSQLRNKLLHFEAGFEQLEASRRLLDEQLAEASQQASDLASAKAQLERQVAILAEKLKIESDLCNTKMANQLKHLNCSLQNMEEANEKLSADNERLQSLLSELEETRSKSQVQMAALQADLDQRDEQLGHLQQTLQSKADEIESVQKQFEEKDKVTNQVNVEHDKQSVQQLKDDIEVLRRQSEAMTQLQNDALFAAERQQNEIGRLEQNNVEILSQLKHAKAEKQRIEQELKQSVAQRDKQIANLIKDLKECEHRTIAIRTECNQQTKISRHDMDSLQQKYEQSLHRKSAMSDEIKSLTTKLKQKSDLLDHGKKELEKLQLRVFSEQKKAREVEQQKGNIRKQMAKLEEEKKTLKEQTEILQTQLERKRVQNVKNNDETQLLQQELAKEQTENERKQQEVSRLEEELQKAKSQFESYTKRTEKMAIKLGELQASQIKQQKELDQRHQAQLAQAETIITLQREKEHLIMELGQLKDRLSKTEQREAFQMKHSQETHSEAVAGMRREIESLQHRLNEAFTNLSKSKTEAQTKIVSLQEQLDGAQLFKQKSEIERATCNERLIKLEKLRESQEKKIRHLDNQLLTADEVKVQLNYEIGGLNSEIEQHKRKMTEVNAQLQESIDLQMQLKVAQSERDQGKKEIAELSNKLSELRQEVVESQLIHECELDEKTRELEIERRETAERVAQYQTHVDELQQQLEEKIQELGDLNVSRNDLCATFTKKGDEEANARELAVEELYRERSLKNQLERDCQILQAKYREAKEEVKRCEQKIKDQRLELEGKLEKMKNKMDGPHSCSLDDSMSALLSTTGTSTGTRKKTIGTHYKRPGPPTPSKNGGRLSFGGTSEPPREILRETCDNGTSKTPARFKIFSSRFSLGSSSSNSSALPRDEPPRRKRQNQNLLTGLQRRKLQLRAMTDSIRTSTPRKSRSYYDQRRLISVSDAVSDEEMDVEPAEKLPPEKAEKEEGESTTPHLSNADLIAMTRGLGRRLSTNHCYSRKSNTTTTSGSSGQVVANANASGHRRRKVRMGNSSRRVSLNLHGNIFAKMTFSRSKKKALSAFYAQREQQRKKVRQQHCFDQARQLSPNNATYNVDDINPIESQTKTISPDNNNYSLHNRNENHEVMGLGQTVVVNKHEQSEIDVASSFRLSENNVAATFNIMETSHKRSVFGDSTKRLQQQFEDENLQRCSFWLASKTSASAGDEISDDNTNHDYRFEQLCKETASTAPFHLQPLYYDEMNEEEEEERQEQQQQNKKHLPSDLGMEIEMELQELELNDNYDPEMETHHISGITNGSCATNVTTMTSASSHRSCTIYSLGNIQTHRMPQINVTQVQRLSGLVEQKTNNQIVDSQPIGPNNSISLGELLQMFRLLNLTGRLMITLMLSLLIVLYCYGT